MSILTKNLDSRPYTGIRKVEGKLKIKDNEYITKFFNNTPNYEQIKNVTIGKYYDILEIEGLGDVEDVMFIDDIGEKQSLADFFWEE